MHECPAYSQGDDDLSLAGPLAGGEGRPRVAGSIQEKSTDLDAEAWAPHRFRTVGARDTLKSRAIRTVGAKHALPTTRSESVRVFVLPQGAGVGGLGFRCPLEQEAEVRRDERVRRGHRVGVVNGPVPAREGDPARVLAQPVLQLGPDLA